MFKILTHEAFALNRKHARVARYEFQLEPEELERLPFEGSQGEDSNRPLSPEALNETLDQDLAAGLKTLTDTERAVLLLRAIGDLRYREIAESLRIPLGSVMGNLARARQKMRALIARAARRTNVSKEN
jgi:RNA polymerase sigma-70 factor (ECF subfamily)